MWDPFDSKLSLQLSTNPLSNASSCKFHLVPAGSSLFDLVPGGSSCCSSFLILVCYVSDTPFLLSKQDNLTFFPIRPVMFKNVSIPSLFECLTLYFVLFRKSKGTFSFTLNWANSETRIYHHQRKEWMLLVIKVTGKTLPFFYM